MKRLLLIASLVFTATLSMQAQKFALVDMDYIFKNIPAYERANEQLNQVSKKWDRGSDTLQELPERGGIPLARAEEGQAGCHRCQGERGCRPEEEILRS